MTSTFADSYYFLALLSEGDEGHTKAVDFAKSFPGRYHTTEWILIEVGDAAGQPQKRSLFVDLLRGLQNDGKTAIVEASHDLFARGVELFAARLDKPWSLTDCISFVVMQEHGIREALTGDHHFEQAGFVALLR